MAICDNEININLKKLLLIFYIGLMICLTEKVVFKIQTRMGCNWNKG